MAAYRQAMLSVPPERVEQFSLEVKQSIKAKKSKHSSKKSVKSRHKKEKSSSKTTKSKSSNSKRKSSKDSKRDMKRKKKHSEPENLTDDSDMEENGLDLSNELHPIGHYVKDRQGLCDMLFNIVKGAKLAAMLPDILKDMPMDVLRQKCFSHLEVMSSKRISHILAGEPMHSSSGTDSEEEEKQVLRNNEALAKEQDSKSGKSSENDDSYNLQTNFVDSTTSSGCEVLSLLAAGSEQDHKNVQKVESNEESVSKANFDSIIEKVDSTSSSASDDQVPDSRLNDSSDIEEEIETVEIVEDVEYAEMVDAMLEEPLAPSDDQEESIKHAPQKTPNNDKNKSNNESGLSQLELLELQLRARAIKSLMKASQSSNESS